jgi:beta-mannosidase
MYGDIFRGVLPKVLSELHPEVYYWETSPSVSSSSTKTISSGDIHFWRVWAAGAPIEEYE